jgi:hypothetical protein
MPRLGRHVGINPWNRAHLAAVSVNLLARQCITGRNFRSASAQVAAPAGTVIENAIAGLKHCGTHAQHLKDCY